MAVSAGLMPLSLMLASVVLVLSQRQTWRVLAGAVRRRSVVGPEVQDDA